MCCCPAHAQLNRFYGGSRCQNFAYQALQNQNQKGPGGEASFHSPCIIHVVGYLHDNNIILTEPIRDHLFPFGRCVGDTMVPPSLDATSDVTFKSNVTCPFFETEEDRIFVSICAYSEAIEG